MNKIDLIIENIEYAKQLVTEQAKNELLDEALAAARELKALMENHKGWLDEFGNVFPLGAYTTNGKLTWMDAHKRGWTPLYAKEQS